MRASTLWSERGGRENVPTLFFNYGVGGKADSVLAPGISAITQFLACLVRWSMKAKKRSPNGVP